MSDYYCQEKLGNTPCLLCAGHPGQHQNNSKFWPEHDTDATLEDRFAMAALTGLLLREDTRGWAWDSFGAHAFQIARACMAERSKK